MNQDEFYALETWLQMGRGPRYQQLYRHINAAILSGQLAADDQIPSERDIARLADISRVTVRKAITQLVADGLIEQRRGAGSFVSQAGPKLKQSLSSLVSFTENMLARGITSSSVVLAAELALPTPNETVALGLSSNIRVARIGRLRSAGGVPMALERSTLPEDILPEPKLVKTSLYAILRASGQAPTRAIQRVSAVNLDADNAALLKLPEGSAVLKIERTGYIATGRPIEFTTGIYRSDIYDFVSELRPDEGGSM